MHITNQQSQHIDKAGVNQVIAKFNDKQYSRYQTLAEKIGARLHSNKAGSDFEMIEKFYYHLLPVTYREWMQR